MTISQNQHSPDLLTAWCGRQQRSKTSRVERQPTRRRIRFAFYGRVSTEEHQDWMSSRQWQFDSASELIGGRGHIVAEFFDIGYSRRIPWQLRPQAEALLAAVADPNRAFDAIVIGECERAFYGAQLLHLLPTFVEHGIQVWLPELDGPFDPDNQLHELAIMQLGAQSRREVLRSRFRTTAAMRAQAREQGRYLGGRPPYGYRLIDAGPHPNRAHAQWGRRLQKLDPDRATAPHVVWMFTQRLTGRSIAGIAHALNDDQIPSPSSADADRNPHRAAHGWTVRTVATILANPRYTGRQVWNRQRTDRDLIDPADVRKGHKEVLRLNPAQDWVISTNLAHEPLVSEQDFIAVQTIRSRRPAHDGTRRTYLFAGLLRCGICDRRMDAHWVNNRPGYRCRHGHNSAKIATPDRPRNLYVREDETLAYLTEQLARAGGALDCRHIANNLRANEMMIIYDGAGWALHSGIRS